jgi:hypothetical protein
MVKILDYLAKKTLDEIKNDLVRENIDGRCEPRA